jgi:hypothetical protein
LDRRQRTHPGQLVQARIRDECPIPYFNLDLTAAALEYPQFLDVGGNTGKTNTFTGVDLQNLTGGVYNVQTLAQGDNAACFAFQYSQQAAPDLLKGLFSSIYPTSVSIERCSWKGILRAELSSIAKH